jgi:hypothetical protein
MFMPCLCTAILPAITWQTLKSTGHSNKYWLLYCRLYFCSLVTLLSTYPVCTCWSSPNNYKTIKYRLSLKTVKFQSPNTHSLACLLFSIMVVTCTVLHSTITPLCNIYNLPIIICIYCYNISFKLKAIFTFFYLVKQFSLHFQSFLAKKQGL